MNFDTSGWYTTDAKFAFSFDATTPDIEVTEGPEVPPPVWDDRPIDADRAMAAVRALSGG
jgi:hypothetical protein